MKHQINRHSRFEIEQHNMTSFMVCVRLVDEEKNHFRGSDKLGE